MWPKNNEGGGVGKVWLTWADVFNFKESTAAVDYTLTPFQQEGSLAGKTVVLRAGRTGLTSFMANYRRGKEIQI